VILQIHSKEELVLFKTQVRLMYFCLFRMRFKTPNNSGVPPGEITILLVKIWGHLDIMRKLWVRVLNIMDMDSVKHTIRGFSVPT
jgi:hypothetical protein